MIKITDASIDYRDVIDAVADERHGAEVIFAGRVRNWNQGRRVVAVSYDVFDELAEAEIKKIDEEARAKWGDTLRLSVVHRKGKLRVGEVSVLIGASSPHRAQCYAASRYVIEQIKTRVPIWKKEHYEDGESEWLQGHALCSHEIPSGDHPDGREVSSHGSR